MNAPKKWVGHIQKEILFKGSKSEGEYLTFHEEDGGVYRIRVVGDPEPGWAEAFLGHRVALEGIPDDLRGHLRLSITTEAVQQISLEDLPQVELSSLDPEANEDK